MMMSIDSSITADTEEAITSDPPEKQTYSHYGLDVYGYNGQEYAVADNDDAADEAAAEAVMESLWAFRARFIAGHCTTKLNDKHIQAIEKMQGEMCEGAGPIIEALLGNNLDAAIDDAIESDGRGHFLSHQDGEEHDGEEYFPGWKGKLVYLL
jgi:hypothetical protein